MIEGAADDPVYLWIHNGKTEIRPATHLWGQDALKVQESIQREIGDERIRVACIRPAGERKVLLSCIINHEGRAPGRGGNGAILGSKNLKAVAVRGNGNFPIHDLAAYNALCKKIAKDNATTPAVAAMREYVSTSRRTGRAEKDEHVQGVNASEMEVVLRPGRPKDRLLEEMRRAVATIPGAQVSFGQPISHRIDHMISGSKSNLAVKIFGPDLSVLRGLAASAQKVLAEVPGIVDLGNQEQASVPQLLIEFDRPAMARHGVTAASLARTVEALFQGSEVGQVAEGGVVSRVVVRYPEDLRRDRDQIESLPVTTPGGRVLPLAEVARIRFDLGPSLIRRENVQRMAMLTANVAGADLPVARTRLLFPTSPI